MSVAPHRPKGPPLNAMRAFEAAARLESFVAAAEELSVTPGAISQHVKTLENWAGVGLFLRNAQGVTLTDAGRALLPDFIAAFDALGAATHALRTMRPAFSVHIAALPSVAQLWLPVRLGHVRQQLPHITISVTAMESPPNLARELFDLSLFFEEPDAQKPHQHVIARDHVFPVCAPIWADRLADGAQPRDVPLLHDQTWKEDWAFWAAASKTDMGDTQRGQHYSLYSLALEEAKSGAGLLMGHALLVESALANGDLVPLAPTPYDTGRALVLAVPQHVKPSADMAALIRLLCA